VEGRERNRELRIHIRPAHVASGVRVVVRDHGTEFPQKLLKSHHILRCYREVDQYLYGSVGDGAG